ncbi:MAG TPA: metalloregulator ArsR/SmtB family transcription factor [Mycobacteriales bacterium]
MTADDATADATDAGAAPDIGTVLAALADPTRRRLLDVLAEAGRASGTALAGRLPVSRQAVAKHLQVLESAGLVEGTREGREVLYSVRPASLDASARWLAELAAAWDRRLAGLKRAAEAAVADRPDPS